MSLSSVFSVALVAGFLVSVTLGDVLTGPQNNAGVAGGSLSITCQTTQTGSERVQFVEYTTNPNGALISDGNKLLLAHPNYPRYDLLVNNITGVQTLTISPTVPSDGGMYECRDQNQLPSVVPYRSQIIILTWNSNFTTTLPQSRVVLLNDYYTAECRATYTGAVAPYIVWTGTPPFQQVYTNSTTQAWAGMSFTVAKAHDASAFNCRTNFTADQFANEDPTVASNVPTYSYTTGTGMIFVQWAPFNMTYYPALPSYEIGQVLTCWADGLPTVSYTWTNVITQVSYPSQTLTLTPDMVGLLALRCQARNSVGTADLFTNITVNPITTTSTPASTTPTTTVAPVAPCDPITGRWEYARPDGTTIALCFYYDYSAAILYGLVMNTTNDPFATDSIGYAREPSFSDFGVVTEYAVAGVGAFAGECRKCYGTEYMIVNGVSRSSLDAFYCNMGSDLVNSPTMTFFRVTPKPPCPTTTRDWQAQIANRQAKKLRV